MLRTWTKIALPLAALMLVGAGNAWAATLTPNSGPIGGGQLVTLRNGGAPASFFTDTIITINGKPSLVATINLDGSEAYFTTVNVTKAGIYDVVITGTGAALGPITDGYQAIPAARNNMLQVTVTATLASIAEIAWDSTTSLDSVGFDHSAGGTNTDINPYTWIVRDPTVSGPAVQTGAGAAKYFVDLMGTYVTNDGNQAPAAFNGGTGKLILHVRNVSKPTTTAIKIFATAQQAAGSTWQLSPAVGAPDAYTLSANDNNGGGPFALGASAVKLSNAAPGTIANATFFDLVLTYVSPTTTNVGTPQTATVQLTGTL